MKRLNTNAVATFCSQTHVENLKTIRQSLGRSKWHWMLPEDWDENPQNIAVLHHAITSFLYTIKAI